MKRFLTSLLLAASLIVGAGAVSPPVSAAGTTPSSRVASSTPGTGTAVISWAAVAGATKYQARVLVGTVPIKTSASLAASATSYTFTGLEYNVPYYLEVRSYDASWSSYGSAGPVTPQAANPSPPPQPIVSVIEDKRLKAEWTAPTSDGGSPISSYSVQLLQGGVANDEPIITSALQVELDTSDTTSSYSVTVVAINKEGNKSKASEASDPIAAEKKAVSMGEADPGSGDVGDSPSTGGNSPSEDTGSSPSPGEKAPSTGTGSSPSPGEKTPAAGTAEKAPAADTGNPASVQKPDLNQNYRPVSMVPNVPAYTKVIKAKSTTSSKTLLSLSKLPMKKGSKASYTVATTSKKVCKLVGSSLKNLKAGTCSVKVTVKAKSGKKSSRTVKLIAR